MSAQGAPKKKRRWVRWAVLAVVLVAAGFIVAPMLTGAQTATAQTTAVVERTDLDVTVSGSGNAIVEDVTEVDPGITGTVTDLSVKLGDTVKKGQLLFRIENDDLDAAVERATTSLRQARQQVEQSRSSLIQAQNNLYAAQHPSAVGTSAPKPVDTRAVNLAKQQVTVAEAGLTAAKGSVSSAETALDQAEDNADKRTVTAPVSGVVTILNAKNGQSLSGGGSSSSGLSAASATGSSSAPVEISDLSTVRARVQVNEVDLIDVKVGQGAAVTFDAIPDLTASGTVSAIAPTGTNSSGVVTYDVDITLTTADARMRPTMSCTAEIVTDERPGTLVVPSSAVHTDAATQKRYAVVVTADGSSSQVVVKTGAVVGTRTEILSGLEKGQTVLVGSESATTGSGTGSGQGPGRVGGTGMGAILGGGR